MSARGPTAPKGSEGPRQMYAQGFAERGQAYGGQGDRELQSQGRIDIKSKATFTKHRSYIGNGDG